MPKKSFVIDDFSGGMTDVGSGRDIKKEKSSLMVNLNPNSESGTLVMHGSGKNQFNTVINSYFDEDDLQENNIDAYNTITQGALGYYFKLKPGHGVFKIYSDYGGLKEINMDLGSVADSEVSGSTIGDEGGVAAVTDNPTEYIFIVSQVDWTTGQNTSDGNAAHSDTVPANPDYRGGFFIYLLENRLDGTNHMTIASQNNQMKFLRADTIGLDRFTHPCFFYAKGGVRIVNGNDSLDVPSPYCFIRKVTTDFGQHHKEYFGTNDDSEWEEGDSPYTNHWVVQNIRDEFDTASENNYMGLESDGSITHPANSASHGKGLHQPSVDVLLNYCQESDGTPEYDDDASATDAGQMADDSCMFMINNHIHNQQNIGGAWIRSISPQAQLRACTGKNVIKMQMVLTNTPNTGDGGAWSFDLAHDKFYMTYVYDNGIETRLTRVTPCFAGWAFGNTNIELGHPTADNQTHYGEIDNIRWFPNTWSGPLYDSNPDTIPASNWKYLGGAFGSTGKADGLAMKIQCMIGNETLKDSEGNTHYSDNAAGFFDGSWDANGIGDGTMGIKKIRLYLKSSRAYGNDNAYLMASVDVEKGIRLNGSPKYNKWSFESTTYPKNYNYTSNDVIETTYTGDELAGRGKFMFCETDLSLVPIPIESYRTLNQVIYEDLVLPSFKAATVINKRAYVGNLRIRGSKFPDRMMKSSVGKYDVFPQENFIDVEIQDADEIIHLSSFGDKILQFKKNILHIISTREDFEMLDSSYRYAGVTSSSQVTETDFGIIWANGNGLFFFDGTKLQNLLEEDGTPMLKKETWHDVMSTKKDREVVVGYLPSSKDIVIMRQSVKLFGLGEDGDETSETAFEGGFVYNLYKKNIVKLEKRFFEGVKSNFVVTRDGALAYAVEGESLLRSFRINPAEENLYTGTLLKTKDIDFNNPSIRKTITSIYITYKSSYETFVSIDANVKKIDASEETVENIGGTDGYRLASTDGEWKSVRISSYYDQSAAAEKSLRTKLKNVTSMSVVLKRNFGRVPKDFAIDDIAIIYREKNIR